MYAFYSTDVFEETSGAGVDPTSRSFQHLLPAVAPQCKDFARLSPTRRIRNRVKKGPARSQVGIPVVWFDQTKPLLRPDLLSGLTGAAHWGKDRRRRPALAGSVLAAARRTGHARLTRGRLKVLR